MNKFYKIVRREKNGKLYSVVEWNFRIEYYINEWATAPFGKLFVFQKYKHVYNLLEFYHDTRQLIAVYECEVQNPKICEHVTAGTENYERFWRKDRHCPMFQAPVGTFVVDAVKLQKIITSD